MKYDIRFGNWCWTEFCSRKTTFAMHNESGRARWHCADQPQPISCWSTTSCVTNSYIPNSTKSCLPARTKRVFGGTGETCLRSSAVDRVSRGRSDSWFISCRYAFTFSIRSVQQCQLATRATEWGSRSNEAINVCVCLGGGLLCRRDMKFDVCEHSEGTCSDI